MAQPEQPKESRRRRVWRWVGWFALGGVGILLVAYFVLTSNTFFKGFILPRMGQAMNATATVSEVSIRPFRQVVLHDLKVQLREHGASVSAKQVFARYSLLSLLGGTLAVEEVTLESPTVRIAWPPETTNLLGSLPSTNRLRTPRGSPPSRSKSMAVELAKVAVSNGTFSFIQTATNGSRMLVELTDLNVALNNVKNGQTARLTLGSGLKFNLGLADSLSKLSATLKGDFQFALDQDLQPVLIKGEATATIAKASGAFADAALIDAKMGVDLTLTEIKKVAVHFTRDTATLGLISLSGPFELLKQEGDIHAKVTGIGREVLSLVGGPYGLDFGNPQLAANLDLELMSHGQIVRSSGDLTANQFCLTRTTLTNTSTPVINLELIYDATVDRPGEKAAVRQLALRATQDDRPFLAAALSRPITLDWRAGGQTVDEGVEEGVFALSLTNLNLAHWRAFVGPLVHTGEISAAVTANVQRGGQQIDFELNSEWLGLGAQWGSHAMDHADVDLLARGTVSNFTWINLAVLNAAVQHQNEPVFSLAGSGRYQRDTQDATLQTEVVAGVPELTRMLHLQDVMLTSGLATFRTYLTQTNHATGTAHAEPLDRTLFAKLQVNNVTGRIGSNRLDRMAVQLQLDASQAAQVLDLQPLQLTSYRFDLGARDVPLAPLVHTFNPAYTGKVGGTLNAAVKLADTGVTGTNRFKNLTGQFDIGTTNLNLALVDLNLPVLKDVMNVIRNLPGLARSLPGGWEKVRGAIATARQGSDQAWIEELSKSPVDVILGRGQVRGDRVEVESVRLHTAEFQAELHGVMRLAAVMTNSTIDLPVAVRLRRSLAEKIKWVPATTPTNAAYVRLPEFFKMGGTVGKAMPDLIDTGVREFESQAIESMVPKAAPLLPPR